MCKVLMTIGIKRNKRVSNTKFLMASLPYMSKTDNDGIGYVACDGDNMWGERWLTNKNAFKTKAIHSDVSLRIKDWLGEAAENNEKEYNSFGSESMLKDATSILLHTRKATCAKNITNTHPFVIGDTALIHNGIIKNDEKILANFKSKRISTCDSESILQEYLYSGVNLDIAQIKNVGDMLDGWYVAGVVSKDKNGRQIVDVFKCDHSNLHLAFIKELDSAVLCTTMDIIEKTCKDAKMTILGHTSVKGGFITRYDAKTGEKLAQHEFVPECLEKHKQFYSASSSSSSSGSDYSSGGVFSSRNSTYNYHARGY